MMPTSSAKGPRTAGCKVLSLSALALLLVTGCGAKEELSSSSGPASSSASASLSASDNASPEATASPSEAQRYSGGSKASEGEYRAADEQGPAQNVPRPVEPEGMNEESEEGLKKFLAYWEYSVNYAIQTGDTSYAEKLISDEYTGEKRYYLWLNQLYEEKGWVVGALRRVSLGEGFLTSHGDGKYSWDGTMEVLDMYSYLEGTSDYTDNSSTVDEPVAFFVHFESDSWKIDGVKILED